MVRRRSHACRRLAAAVLIAAAAVRAAAAASVQDWSYSFEQGIQPAGGWMLGGSGADGLDVGVDWSSADARRTGSSGLAVDVLSTQERPPLLLTVRVLGGGEVAGMKVHLRQKVMHRARHACHACRPHHCALHGLHACSTRWLTAVFQRVELHACQRLGVTPQCVPSLPPVICLHHHPAGIVAARLACNAPIHHCPSCPHIEIYPGSTRLLLPDMQSCMNACMHAGAHTHMHNACVCARMHACVCVHLATCICSQARPRGVCSTLHVVGETS